MQDSESGNKQGNLSEQGDTDDKYQKQEEKGGDKGGKRESGVVFETGSIKFFKKKVGQVIVKGPCSTDQWLIFIEVWKVNKKLQDSQRKYLMGPRKKIMNGC